VRTLAFGPEEERRVTSPEMSVVVASVFVCLGIDCCRRPHRKPA
jgi:hypothetical protein